MKILKKADIIKLKQVDHVISENTILADIDHPFLVRHTLILFYVQILKLKLFEIGGSQRFLAGSSLFILPDGLHPRR